jgi:YVTN family beta-propeller protein
MRIFTLPGSLRIAVLLTTFMFGSFGFIAEASGAPTGKPVAYAITPKNTITVIDTGSHAVLNTITLAAAASFIVGTPDGKQIYVTSQDATVSDPAVVWVIDTQTGLVKATLPLPEFPAGMVISTDGTRVYVATQIGSDYGGTLTVIDTSTNTIVANLATSEDFPNDIAVSPDGKRVYVPNLGDNAGLGSFDVFDTASNTLVKTLVQVYFSQYSWVAVSSDSSKVYTYDMGQDSVTGIPVGVIVYDAATYAVLKTLPVPAPPDRLTLPLPKSSILYGSSGGSLLVYNTQTDTMAATVAVATTINNLALTPDGTQLYASNSNAQSIAIIDTATNAVTGSVAVAGATGMAIVAAPSSQVLLPPVITLELSPSSVPPGSPSQLAWTSTGATSCTSSGEWTGARALQGSINVSAPAPGSHTYTLSCTGPGGTSAASARLTVIPGSTLTFSASDILVNSTTVLSWKSFAGATSCTGTWSGGSLPTSGSTVIGPYPFTFISQAFTLSCVAPSGSDRVTQVLKVFAPGPLSYTALTPPNDNVYTLASPGTKALGGGLDGHGYAYDSQDPSLQNPLTALGQTFSIGSASKPTGISRQTIALGSKQLANVTFLATAVNGNQLNQPFVVTYSDGTTMTHTQSLSDWRTPQSYSGETSMALSYRITPTGAQQAGPWFFYAYQITLDPTKVATSLKLPNNRNVILLAINETKAPTASPESIASAFNVVGLATVGHAATNGRLGQGYAFDASLLPTGFTGAGQKFAMGPADQPDAVSNKTIALTAKNRLGLSVLATAVDGNQLDQTFMVTYSDGSTTKYTQSMSDWGRAQHYPGELIARNTADRITPTGARQAGVWDIYAYILPTDSSKQVVSLTLPNNRHVAVFAVNSLTP